MWTTGIFDLWASTKVAIPCRIEPYVGCCFKPYSQVPLRDAVSVQLSIYINHRTGELLCNYDEDFPCLGAYLDETVRNYPYLPLALPPANPSHHPPRWEGFACPKPTFPLLPGSYRNTIAYRTGTNLRDRPMQVVMHTHTK